MINKEADCGELGERAIEIFELLRKANPHPKSELVSDGEFQFCVSVILSAQTTDKAVNKATAKLFEVADTPGKMLALGLDGLKEYIKSIGLYNNKAKHIIALSEALMKGYSSKIPMDREVLEKLPGIGRKSANVILNALWGMEYIAVDTHVLRVSKRLGLTQATTPLAVERDLMELVPQEYIRYASDWLVLHGRYTCLARNPKCVECILSGLCWYTRHFE
ncbi:MAG: endonuclease III [Holosporales bacterium]|jgi:endonuclease-3|nr:endonuclease III [Holosporales bacterium]